MPSQHESTLLEMTFDIARNIPVLLMQLLMWTDPQLTAGLMVDLSSTPD